MNEYYQEIKRQDKIIDSLVNVLPDGKSGNVVVDNFTVGDEEVKHTRMMAIMGGYGYEYYDFKPGTYKRLIVDRETMMSTTQMERNTNREIMSKANGDVFIAGLGLGMILMPIQDRKDVKSITVVENNPHVIELVAKKLPLNTKVDVIEADVFNYTPTKKFDTVYFDIWVGICSDNYDEMKELTRKFKNKVNRSNPNHILTAWRKSDVKRMAHQEKRDEAEREMWSKMWGKKIQL